MIKLKKVSAKRGIKLLLKALMFYKILRRMSITGQSDRQCKKLRMVCDKTYSLSKKEQ